MAHALVIVQQMWRGVAADTVSCGMQYAFQHGAHRALAVGPAYRDDGEIGLKIETRCLT
ncbi:MAG: hypothetical protein WDM70_07430 [Nitrosomonadales bacterium]